MVLRKYDIYSIFFFSRSRYYRILTMFLCAFFVPVNNFSVMSRQSHCFLCINKYSWEYIGLPQEYNPVPTVYESKLHYLASDALTTSSPRSLYPYIFSLQKRLTFLCTIPNCTRHLEQQSESFHSGAFSEENMASASFNVGNEYPENIEPN